MAVTIAAPAAATPSQSLPLTVLMVLCAPFKNYTDIKRNKVFLAGSDYPMPIDEARLMMDEKLDGQFVFDVSTAETAPGITPREPAESTLPPEIMYVPPSTPAASEAPPVTITPPADPASPPAAPPADPAAPTAGDVVSLA